MSIDAPVEVRPGSDFVAGVEISEVSDFDACQFDLSYDASVIEVSEVSAGAVASTTIPIDMWGFVPAGQQGKIRVLANVPGVPGVDGSGYLARVHFHVIGQSNDSSPIALSNGLIADKFGDPIEGVTWRDGSITVKDLTLDESTFLPLILSD